MKKNQNDKWSSVGNDELSDTDNSIKTGTRSMGNPLDSLPIDVGTHPFRELSQKVVIDTDDRYKVVMKYPYNCIALLCIEFAGVVPHYGTGFFVSERCIATSGHCVFYNGQWAKSVTVIPGANLGGYPAHWGQATAAEFRSVSGWVTNREPDYDYGAVILPDNRLHSKIRGTLGYADFTTGNVELSGYPEGRSQEQYSATGVIARIKPNRLYYTLDTSPGQSGSPVFVRNGDKSIVVGIHRGTNDTGTENYAIRITDGVMCRLQEWSNL
jgi:V8-like Glu-specific endopeptidase